MTCRADKLTCPKWGTLLSLIWPWRSRSIVPEINRNLNQGLLHLWCKFGDPSLTGWWIIVQTNSWLTDTPTHTHTCAQATAIPEGQNWPRVTSEKNFAHIKTYTNSHTHFLQNIFPIWLHSFEIHFYVSISFWNRLFMICIIIKCCANYSHVFNFYINLTGVYSYVFHWYYCKPWFRHWVGTRQTTNYYLKQWWPIHWHIYALEGLNKSAKARY